MIGNMKWITAAKTMIITTPMITMTAKIISSGELNEGISNSNGNRTTKLEIIHRRKGISG